MSLSTWFGWKSDLDNAAELPALFPLDIKKIDFIKTDIINIFSKILTDVAERTHGLSDDQVTLLWDNCVKSESGDGLITLLAKAMADKKDLFLVYDKAVGVIRMADDREAATIKADYEQQGASTVGVYISFKNYLKSDMIKLYSALEYCTIGSLNKTINLSSAIQFKMNDLRASVSLSDSDDVKAQALQLANGMAAGRDVYCDAKDEIITTTPDVTSIEQSIKFIDQKRSFYLGLPASYINGEQTGGIGSTGEGDQRAVERGLKNYYYAVMKPVLESVFGIKASYKSQDFRQIAGSLEVLKTFDVTSDDYLSAENKQSIVNKIFDLPDDAKGDPPAKVSTVAVGSARQPATGGTSQSAKGQVNA